MIANSSAQTSSAAQKAAFDHSHGVRGPTVPIRHGARQIQPGSCSYPFNRAITRRHGSKVVPVAIAARRPDPERRLSHRTGRRRSFRPSVFGIPEVDIPLALAAAASEDIGRMSDAQIPQIKWAPTRCFVICSSLGRAGCCLQCVFNCRRPLKRLSILASFCQNRNAINC